MWIYQKSKFVCQQFQTAFSFGVGLVKTLQVLKVDTNYIVMQYQIALQCCKVPHDQFVKVYFRPCRICTGPTQILFCLKCDFATTCLIFNHFVSNKLHSVFLSINFLGTSQKIKNEPKSNYFWVASFFCASDHALLIGNGQK